MTKADNPKDFTLWDDALRRRANILHDVGFENVPQKEIARQQNVHVSNISGKYIRAKKERTAGVI